MGKRGRIKQTDRGAGARIVAPPEPRSTQNEVAVFSLRYCCSGEFGFDALDQAGKAAFASAIFLRREMTWADLRRAHRHGAGFEQLNNIKLAASLPQHVVDEDHTLLAFRFHAKAAMVGYRIDVTFHVLFFDPKFNLYDHG